MHWRLIHLSLSWTCGTCYNKWQLFLLINYLFYNQIGDSGVTSISDVLNVNSSLTWLNLRVICYNKWQLFLLIHYLFWNQFGDSGVTSISDALKVNSSLTFLDLNRYWKIVFCQIVFIVMNPSQCWWVWKRSNCWCSWIKYNNHQDSFFLKNTRYDLVALSVSTRKIGSVFCWIAFCSSSAF